MNEPTIHTSNNSRTKIMNKERGRKKTGRSSNKRGSKKWIQPPPPRSPRQTLLCKEFSSFPEDVPKECLLNMLSFLNGDEIRQVEQVCHKFRSLIKTASFVNDNHTNHMNVRTIQIRCISRSWKCLFQKLDFLDEYWKTFSRGYYYCKLQILVDLDKFKKLKHRDDDEDARKESTTAKKKEHAIISGIKQLEILDRSAQRRMTISGSDDGGRRGSGGGVFSRLSISSSSSSTTNNEKIDEIDKAKVVASRPVLSRFVMIAPNIEQISWKGHRYAMSILGDSLRSLRHLRGIYMSSSIFYTDNIVEGTRRSIRRRSRNRQQEGSNPPSYRIFQHCSQHLVQVDILNCKVQNFCWAVDTTAAAAGSSQSTSSTFSPASSNLIACYKSEPISQEALMEFVRQTPTLRWFRSDLIPLNISILKEERPEVDFISL